MGKYEQLIQKHLMSRLCLIIRKCCIFLTVEQSRRQQEVIREQTGRRQSRRELWQVVTVR